MIVSVRLSKPFQGMKIGLAEIQRTEKNIEKALKSLKNMGNKSPELAEDSDYQQAMDLLGKMLDTL